MKSTVRLSLGLITFSSFLAFTACGDDDDTPPGGAGSGSEAGSPSSTGGTGNPEPGHGGSEAKAGDGHGGGGHADAPAICQVVGSLCHDADTGPGMGRDCHQLGHAGDLETCEEQFAGCIGLCVEGDSGAGGASGEAQDPYCAALGSLCHPVEAGIGPECHDTGHEGDAAACAASFDECAHFCLEEREKLSAGVTSRRSDSRRSVG
jgi:hypothetical protein